MDDVHFKDIRVLPTALDLKSNTKKNLVEILNQLQTGSILKGLVVGSTPKGDSIFNTAHGRFSIPNTQGLLQGDKITIQIVNNANYDIKLKNSQLKTVLNLLSLLDVSIDKVDEIIRKIAGQ